MKRQDEPSRLRGNPLSPSQERRWILDQLHPQNFAQNLACGFRVAGKLDPATLTSALNEVVRQHEILRTEFHAADGAPEQMVLPSAHLKLNNVDLCNFSQQEREARLARLAQEETQRPFDLSRGPLLRATLFHLSDTEYVLLVVVHRIVCDENSARLLLNQVAESYGALRNGKPPAAVEGQQYMELVARPNPASAEQLSYWKQRLAGAPSSIDLPTDRPRPPVQTFRGGQLSISIDLPLLERLRDLSRREDATLFMTLLAALNVLLFRYSRQDDLVVGTRVAGREDPRLQDAIGPLENTVLFRVDLSGEPSFTELVRRVREIAQGAFSHQDLPFETLIEQSSLERDLSRNPLFQILFTLQEVSPVDFSIGLPATPFRAASGIEEFDLSVKGVEGENRLEVTFSYNTDLFDNSTIERLAEQYRVLLGGAVSEPELPISQLPLLGSAERQKLIINWNATEFEYPRNLCLHQWFEQQAQRTPEAVACVLPRENQQGDTETISGTKSKDQHLTYGELNGRANQVGRYLKECGVGPGQRVGVFVERSLEMMVALLGVQKSGAAYVPLDPAYPAERVRLTLEDARVPVILTQQSLLASLPGHLAQVICLDADWGKIAQQSRNNFVSGVTSEDLIYVIFTSGSTGRPKGVEVPHRAVVNLLNLMAQELRMGPQDVFPALASFAFDMCIPELYLGLVTGGRVVIGRRNLAANGEELASLLRRIGATIVHATPTTWNLLLEAGFGGQGLKRVIGAEPLPRDLATRLLEADASLYNFYGPTETTVWSTFHHFRSRHEPIVIGRPLANTQIYILDQNLQPTPIGVPGEIHIGGDGVAHGYLSRPELTAAKFIPHPFSLRRNAKLYKTGDLGRYLADGRIEFQGRSDNQVKVRGYRIELGEIEAVLGKHASVQEAVVIAREDVDGDKQLVGYVVPALRQLIDVSTLRAWVREHLPGYMVPRAIVQMPRLPLSPNGKVDRKNLPAPDYTRPELAGNYLAPRTPSEEVIANTWASVLKLDRVGVDDNFFELGGHSLLAVRLLSEIARLTGRKIPMSAMLRAATVESLARLIDEQADVSDPVAMEIQTGDGTGLPFFAIVPPGEESLGYAMLARHMGSGQRVYKIQGHAPIVGPHPYTEQDLQLLADEYSAAIRSVQPQGPYCLGGLCDGTHIAERVILELEARGQVVGLFAIIDTWVLQNSLRPWLWRVEYFQQRLRETRGRALAEQVRVYRRALVNQMRKLMGKAPARTEWGETYWPSNFVPTSFRAPVVLFKRPRQPFFYVKDPQMGWGARTTGGVEIHEINFDHAQLLREPHVGVLGEKLAACIARLSDQSADTIKQEANFLVQPVTSGGRPA